MSVPPEINRKQGGGLLIVGRDPGWEEERAGRPFVGTSGRILQDCLAEAGIRRQDVNITNLVSHRPQGNVFHAHSRALVERETRKLLSLIAHLRPDCIVALGNEAAYTLTGDWPSAGAGGDVFGAKGIEERRGYFDLERRVVDAPVLATVHPAFVARMWLPWRVLLSYDLQRAKEALLRAPERPERLVEVVRSDQHAVAASEELLRYKRLAFDIEIRDERTLACVGFAPSGKRSIVFPARYLQYARRVLEDPRVVKHPKTAQNGQFDLYFLLTREGIHIEGYQDDSIVAWHACYPELAGAAVNKKGSKRTHKSLAFFSSLFTYDQYWKNYDFANDHEMYVLNGRDCSITWDVTEELLKLVAQMGVQEIYRHGMSLVWPCVTMQARGMRVDDTLRQERIRALEDRIAASERALSERVIPLIQERAQDLRLFQQIEGVCECCRHASKKQSRCWSCAGFESAPSKSALLELAAVRGVDAEGMRKDALEEALLGVCEVCGGSPRREWLEFNPRSNPQKQILLYDLLGLPQRMRKGVLSTDEDTLKGLLGQVQA